MSNPAHTPSPPFSFSMYREFARTLPLEELVDAAKALSAELKERQGQEKYQPAIPPHLVN